MTPCDSKKHPWGSFASSLWGGGTCSTEWARNSLQESALGAGRGGSAPALAEARPGSVPPEHSDVSGQLTSGGSMLNLFICLQQIERKLGEGSRMTRWYSKNLTKQNKFSELSLYLYQPFLQVCGSCRHYVLKSAKTTTYFLSEKSEKRIEGDGGWSLKITPAVLASFSPVQTCLDQREHKWSCHDPSAHVSATDRT